ncbi:hypothetical protein RI138_00010 [Streptomyces sp. C11-1]|uniref:Uncharacterized protein n=1 Tax=Streptomyces durocortorensis TaxID=2811104 RepID=A0ABY9VRF5_9ACTN|nr:hypothetical protein [Streptomyces durocortorensis]WNF25311.1 hypothetical protein RI138_00010 [Streptomyces durocortorensis]
MPSFQHRKAVGDAHELRVTQELTSRGWDVNAWGQGILTDLVRFALQGTSSALRWTPDLIAAKEQHIALIDCKSRMTSRTTSRHAVERAAVTAHFQLVAWTLLPVYYVFDNLDVLTPHEVLATGRHGPYSEAGSGSRTTSSPQTAPWPSTPPSGPNRPPSCPLLPDDRSRPSARQEARKTHDSVP